MNAANIAARLGGTPGSGAWSRCRCPLHNSSGPSLALRDGDRTLIVKCWGGCDPADVLAELRRLGLLEGNVNGPSPDRTDVERRREAAERERQHRVAGALDLWGESRGPGLIVRRYWLSRGLTIDMSPAIGEHTPLWHTEHGGRRPAMVGLVEHAQRGPVGVHITYLAVDGSAQASVTPRKRSLGPVGGGAVRLAPAAETLLVGEGLETAASGMQATGIPAWAALSTSGMVALVLPPIVHTVIILADNDANGAGERAARAAARRWLAQGRRVRIAMPPVSGTDWNDVLLGLDNRGRSHAA
jgi:putative DNA primase/helicase